MKKGASRLSRRGEFDMSGYVVGYILFGLVISFAVIGLCWLIGRRKNPK